MPGRNYEWISVRAIEVNGPPLVPYRRTRRGWHVYYLPHKWHYLSVPFCLLTKDEILTDGITAGPFLLKVVRDKRANGDDGIRVYAYPYPVEKEFPKLIISTYELREAPDISDLIDDPNTIYLGCNGRKEKDAYVYIVRVI